MTPEMKAKLKMKAAIKKRPVLRFFSWLWALILFLTFFIGMPTIIISVIWMIIKAAFL